MHIFTLNFYSKVSKNSQRQLKKWRKVLWQSFKKIVLTHFLYWRSPTTTHLPIWATLLFPRKWDPSSITVVLRFAKHVFFPPNPRAILLCACPIYQLLFTTPFVKHVPVMLRSSQSVNVSIIYGIIRNGKLAWKIKVGPNAYWVNG